MFEEADRKKHTPSSSSRLSSHLTTHPNHLKQFILPDPSGTRSWGGGDKNRKIIKGVTQLAKMAVCLLTDRHLKDTRERGACGLCSQISPQPQCRAKRDNMDVRRPEGATFNKHTQFGSVSRYTSRLGTEHSMQNEMEKDICM